MFQKPEVRFIEPQQVETNSTEVTSSEAAALLAKYGYQQSAPQPIQQNDGHMTIEDWYRELDRQNEEQRMRDHQRRYGPRAITFDDRHINYSNSEYRDLDVDGHNIGIQVQVVSDMPIYGGRRF